MYQIKKSPEDFLVKEISNVKILDSGPYLYFTLKKTNYNTLDAVKLIAKKLHLKEKEIGFAGSKDKKAVTEQVISIKNKKKEQILNLNIPNIKLTFLGYGKEKITLGDLEGNYFEITVRGVNEVKEIKQITNYFGEQRFGRNNIQAGKAFIQKNFQKACQLLNLEPKNNDFIGALKTIPKRLLRLYINAYQSHIWNQTVDKNQETWPLVGWDTDLEDYPSIKEKLKEEGISTSDFIIKQIPELSLEGEMRTTKVKVQNFKILEKGDNWIKISFKLSKGSYATEVIKQMFTKYNGNTS